MVELWGTKICPFLFVAVNRSFAGSEVQMPLSYRNPSLITGFSKSLAATLMISTEVETGIKLSFSHYSFIHSGLIVIIIINV